MPQSKPFHEGSQTERKEWTEVAYRLMQDGKIVVDVDATAELVVTATGSCPACDHELEFEHIVTIVMPGASLGMAGGSSASPGSAGTPGDGFRDFDIACLCSEPHRGRITGERGCGCVFRVSVAVP